MSSFDHINKKNRRKLLTLRKKEEKNQTLDIDKYKNLPNLKLHFQRNAYNIRQKRDDDINQLIFKDERFAEGSEYDLLQQEIANVKEQARNELKMNQKQKDEEVEKYKEEFQGRRSKINDKNLVEDDELDDDFEDDDEDVRKQSVKKVRFNVDSARPKKRKKKKIVYDEDDS